MNGRAVDPNALRRVIRELVSEALDAPTAGPNPATGCTAVAVSNDAELNAFATRLLDLFEDDDSRAALRSGRLSFRLAGGNAPAAPERLFVERTLTEKLVETAAREGRSLLLARRAVVTPLARDRARALGIRLEREA